MGFVEREAGKWKMGVRNIHAPRGSVQEVLHQTNWRRQAILRVPRQKKPDLHYTALYTLAAADIERLRELALRFIEDSRAVVIPSPSEELVCCNLDFFRV
jgi:hypothetical protein